MEATLRSTNRMVTVNGNVRARVWEGETADGQFITALVSRVAPANETTDEQKEAFRLQHINHLDPTKESLKAWPDNVTFEEK